MAYYPAFLDLGGRRCVVLGGGETAAARARGLLEAGATVIVVAIAATPALERLAGEGRLTLLRRPIARATWTGHGWP
jgi:uroporphyrin-III C-methyltransferase / precorrin-2 dehydrogenase / sirohydrochlorin ferrochelatase